MGRGQSLAADVISGVVSTGLPWLIAQDVLYIGEDMALRETAINKARSWLQLAASKISSEYLVLLDSDVVILDAGVIERMVEWLQHNPDTLSVVVDTKDLEWTQGQIETSPKWGHKCCAFGVMRTADYLAMHLSGTMCQCATIEAMGDIHIIPGHYATEIQRRR